MNKINFANKINIISSGDRRSLFYFIFIIVISVVEDFFETHFNKETSKLVKHRKQI